MSAGVTSSGADRLDDHSIELGDNVRLILRDVRDGLDVLDGMVEGATVLVLVLNGRDDVTARVRWDAIAAILDQPTDHPGL